jgi:hypothetical protein
MNDGNSWSHFESFQSKFYVVKSKKKLEDLSAMCTNVDILTSKTYGTHGYSYI